MSKKRARLRFVWISLLVAVFLVMAVIPFAVPFTSDNFNSFAGGIALGFDFRGGQSVVFDCKTDAQKDLDQEIENTLADLQKIIKRGDYLSYNEAVVTKQGSQIKVDVYEANDTFFSWLENAKKLNITVNQFSEEDGAPTVYLTSQHIQNAKFAYRLKEGTTNEAEYGISLDFTTAGTKILKDISRQASNNDEKVLYIYEGDVKDNKLLGKIDCEKALTSGKNVFVESDDMLSDYATALENSYNVASGLLPVSLEFVDTYDFAPILGRSAGILIAVAGAVALVLIMLALWLRYGDFGLLADLALVVFAVLMLFFLQAIPLITLSLPTIIAIALGIALFVDSNIIILERIKQEYAAGKKIPLAVKGGFKRAFWPILDSHIVVAALSIILYFFGSAAIKALTFPLFVCAFVSFFTSQVITRFFIKSYLPLNSTKTKQLRLQREKGVVEIKEEENPAQPEAVNILAPTPDTKVGGEN